MTDQTATKSPDENGKVRIQKAHSRELSELTCTWSLAAVELSAGHAYLLELLIKKKIPVQNIEI
jgi:hypothetical protein